jgi:S-methylmethionine-dependent homocysteine/selenocysteine methylase
MACYNQKNYDTNRCQNDNFITLKDWFLLSGTSTLNTTTTIARKFQQEQVPRILLLDGGVSTHLEDSLRLSHRCGLCNSSSNSNSTTCTSSSNRNMDTTNEKQQDYVFPYRELWSSSLLLTNVGREQVYHGHVDWIERANVNVISTVTYQCHYISTLWPKQQQQQQQQQQDNNTVLANFSDDYETCNTNTPIITNKIMDQIWSDGIRLANEAVQKERQNRLRRRRSCITTAATKDSNNSPVKSPLLSSEHASESLLFVIASSGCYGAALSNGAEYTGLYTTSCTTAADHDESIHHPHDTTQQLQKVIYDFHLQKLQAIVANGPVDGIAIETVPSILECNVLRDLLRSDTVHKLFQGIDEEKGNDSNKMNTKLACYVSLSCRNGSQLNDGTPLVDALQVFHDVDTIMVQAIGLNCCSIRYIPDLIRIVLYDIVHHTPHRSIVVYPNSGELWDGTTKQWVPDVFNSEVSSPMNDTAAIIPSSSSAAAITLMGCVIHHIDTIWNEFCMDTPKLRNRRKPSILIGGCCRMTVETIATLRVLIDEYLS